MVDGVNPELNWFVMKLLRRTEDDGKGTDETSLQYEMYWWSALPYTILDAGARAAPKIWVGV